MKIFQKSGKFLILVKYFQSSILVFEITILLSSIVQNTQHNNTPSAAIEKDTWYHKPQGFHTIIAPIITGTHIQIIVRKDFFSHS